MYLQTLDEEYSPHSYMYSLPWLSFNIMLSCSRLWLSCDVLFWVNHHVTPEFGISDRLFKNQSLWHSGATVVYIWFIIFNQSLCGATVLYIGFVFYNQSLSHATVLYNLLFIINHHVTPHFGISDLLFIINHYVAPQFCINLIWRLATMRRTSRTTLKTQRDVFSTYLSTRL